MATYIKTLKKGEDIVLPRTRSEAVTMANGETLELFAQSLTGIKVINEYPSIVTENTTILANKNALSVGPITINDGVVITIEDGATWTII